MGLEVATIAIAAVAAGATIGKMDMEYQAAQEKEKALDLQGKEMTLANQQKQLSNYEVLQKTLDAQEALMTTRGVAFTSPSFNAIQRATLNIGAKKAKNQEIESSISEENLNIEKQNVRTSLYAQLFGDTANLAFQAASVAGSMPSGGAAGTSKLPQMEA